MKKYVAAAGTLLAIGGLMIASSASKTIIERLEISGLIPMTIPVYNDTVNSHGKRFDSNTLVSSRINPDALNYSKAEVADSAGFTLAKPKQGIALTAGRTRLRADRFFKGKIEVKTNVPVVVLLDNKELISKQDKSSADKSAAIALSPDQTYTLDVRALTSSEDTIVPKLSVSIVPDTKFDDVKLSISPDLKNRFGVTDLTLGNRVNYVSMSPDGRYYITSFTNTYAKDKKYSYTTICDTRNGKTVYRNTNTSLAWLPSGAKAYYIVEGANGKDIRTINPTTGVDEVFVTDIPSDANIVAWSPDMSYFLFYTEDKGVKEEGPLRRYAEPDDRIVGFRGRNFLNMYNVNTGVQTTLTGGTSSTSLADISPDSENIIYASSKTTPSEFPFYVNNIISLNIKTMKTDTIVANDPYVKSASYSPDGKSLVLTGGPLSFNGIGNNSGEHPIPNDFDNQAYIMNLTTRDVKPLTKNFNPSIVSDPVWNKADNKIYFIAEDGFYRRIYCCNPSSGDIKALPQEVDVVRQYSLGNDEGNWLCYTGQSLDKMGAAYMINLKNGKNTLIANPFDETISKMELGKFEPWTFNAKDGTQIDGLMCLPPDFDASRKYPLIVYYYGGTSPSNNSLTSPYNAQLLASRGYVVYILNPSGTTGYGQEFSARHVNAWGKRTADEIIQGTKEFVKAHPFVDGKKIGCMGASYGGFMTEYLQTQTDIFAAAVSHAGISNVTSYWGEGYWGYSYNAVAAAKSYPWTDPELFTKQGALFNADKIHTPLLLLHGTVDTNVPIGESIQLFNALKILGRDVEFISVEGENHFVLDYEKRILWQNTIMAWFAKWLQDDPRWWDEMYPQVHL